MLTQHEKIIKIMARGDKEWWLPADFMRADLGELFVGYEASARLSELRKEYPNVFKTEWQGRFRATKVDLKMLHFLPKHYQKLFNPTGSLF